MQNNNLTAFERELADVLLDSMNVFTPRELEDTLFEVFEEAQNENLEEFDIERRKFLHATMRRFFRTLDQNTEETKKITKKIMQTTFRNIEDIELPNGDFVEAGSLWKKVNDKMILVDEDRYVAAKYNEEKFTPENDSENTKEEI